MMRRSFYLSTILLLFILIACSSSEKSTKDGNSDNNQNYIFDKIPTEKDLNIEDSLKSSADYYYLIQIGAFASKRGANKFARMSEKNLSEKIVVDFSDKVNLYTVRLKRKFNNRYDAEKLRDKLRQQEEFKDAWVVELKK